MKDRKLRHSVSDSGDDDSGAFRNPKMRSSMKSELVSESEDESDTDKSKDESDRDKSEDESDRDKSEDESDRDKSEDESDRDKSEDKSYRDKSSTKYESNVKANFFIEDLSSDDEVYTFQCPSSFSTETLLNIKVDLNEVTQVKEKSGDLFNVRLLESQSKSITCALPSKKKEAALAVVPLAGHIVIQKDLSIPDVNFTRDKDDRVEFPTDLKVRHPLLGVDWKNYISETSKVVETESDDVRRNKRHHENDSPVKSQKKKKYE